MASLPILTYTKKSGFVKLNKIFRMNLRQIKQKFVWQWTIIFIISLLYTS